MPSGDLPCGDISPTVGITGTPVVDAARGEIFVVADELVGGAPAHFLLGFNMYSGTVDLDVAVDPPGQNPADILQRTGLNLSNGNVVFGYGGNDGDCATYSGWVGSVPEGGGTPGYYQAVPIGHDGAVWMGGAAPEVDAAGNIWTTTGNGSSSTPYDYSDSVLELSPSLARTQYFAPSTWSSDNSSDFDLGSSPPALLSNGTVLQVGKSSTAYLLNQASLGGIGGQIGSPISACGSDSDGGDAISGTVVYVPCGSGVQAMQTSPLGTLWQTSTGAPWPPDHRRRARVVDRWVVAVRPEPGERGEGAAGLGRQPGQPLPDAFGRRRAAPGALQRPGLRLLGLGRSAGPARSRRRRRRPTRRTGWSLPTAASSRSATPASTAPPAACR